MLTLHALSLGGILAIVDVIDQLTGPAPFPSMTKHCMIVFITPYDALQTMGHTGA